MIFNLAAGIVGLFTGFGMILAHNVIWLTWFLIFTGGFNIGVYIHDRKKKRV